ncbi:MAG: choice-of-anchor D domain-containing protein [Ignavibacteriales bacterium]|nr:choice-of-anchor D domain-containing protein [Ignavibacteriales bacterium]
MRRIITIFFLLICAFVVFTIHASAQVLIEDFTGTVGTALTSAGWTQSGATTTLPLKIVSAPDVTFTGYVSSGVGDAVLIDTTGQDDYKNFSPDSIGSVYLSFMFNVTKAATGDYFVALSSSLAQTNYYARTFIKSSGAGFVVGVSKSNETATYGTTVFSLNTTYLAVIKYTFVAADSDFISVMILPSGTDITTEPSTAEINAYQDKTKSDTKNLGYITLRQGGVASAPRLFIDGIRIGTSWANSVNGVLEPKVVIAPASIDFGKKDVGVSTTDTITVQNNSVYGTLDITSVSSSDVVFVITPTAATILPKASQKFALTYTPASAVPSSANIVFVSNDPTSPNTVAVSGSGTQAGFSMTPKSLNFGNIFKDSTKTDSIAIANASETAHLVIDSVRSNNTLFTITPTSADIDTSSTTKFAVTFNPIAKGAETGKIVFYHNAPSKQDTLTVEGNGILKEPLFSVTPTAMNLGLLVLGQSKTDSLVVTNIGYDSLIISNVALSNPADTAYTITPTTARLDINASQKFFITFKPTVNGSIPSSFVFFSNVSEVADTVKVVGIGTSSVSIAEARKDLNGDYIADHVATGDTLVCVGIITTPNMGASAGQTSYFIQDSTGGIDVFAYGLSATTYAIGDSVRVIGIVKQYKGLVELSLLVLDDAHFTILKHNAIVPAPKRLSLHQFVTNAENYEGQLIELDDLSKASGTWPAAPSNVSIYVMNASKADTMQMFLDLDANITMAEPIYPINVVGFVSQYSSSTPPNNGYEICPRDTNDITKTPPPPIIVVDGIKDDFYNTLTGPSNGYLQIRSSAYNANGAPRNDADLSAKVWTAWDTTWFYLYAEVKDDTLSGNSPNIWEEDEMEMTFDPQAKDSVRNSCWQARFTALGKATPGVIQADSLNIITDSTSKQWVRTIIPGGYAFELAMKWSAIGATEKVSVAKDSVFGMSICIHDNDGHARREATIEWAAVMADAVYQTPKYLGTVKFLADNKLQFIATNNMTPWRTNPIKYDGTDAPMSVERMDAVIPTEFSLSQNYPNPFNPSTTIEYALPHRSIVTVKIYSILGQEIATLINGEQSAGHYQTIWNASNMASGMYLLRISAQPIDGDKTSFMQVRKMSLMK